MFSYFIVVVDTDRELLIEAWRELLKAMLRTSHACRLHKQVVPPRHAATLAVGVGHFKARAEGAQCTGPTQSVASTQSTRVS